MEKKQESMKALRSYSLLTKDPIARLVLIKDPSALQFLVNCLALNTDAQITEEALKILIILCESSESRNKILSTYGILVTINIAANLNAECKRLSTKLQNLLNSTDEQLDGPPPLGPSGDNTAPAVSKQAPKAKPKSIFLDNKNFKPRNIVLTLDRKITEETKKICSEQLLKVKGISSITYRLEHNQCVVRTWKDTKPELLIKILNASNKIIASQANRSDEEKKPQVNPSAIPRKQPLEMPDYLPEKDSPVKPKALVVPKNGSVGWINSAADFLTRSFYW